MWFTKHFHTNPEKIDLKFSEIGWRHQMMTIYRCQAERRRRFQHPTSTRWRCVARHLLRWDPRAMAMGFHPPSWPFSSPNLRVVEGWDGPKKPTHGDLIPTNMINETHMRATWTMNLQKKNRAQESFRNSMCLHWFMLVLVIYDTRKPLWVPRPAENGKWINTTSDSQLFQHNQTFGHLNPNPRSDFNILQPNRSWG